MKRGIILPVLLLMMGIEIYAQSTEKTKQVYLDITKPLDVRIADLVSKMTVEEKVSQMMSNSPSIARLNIPEYNWWNEW